MDQFNLDRFVSAQAEVYDQALSEIVQGRKTSHWMWFIFPQAEGLGMSAMSRRYAIASLDEARAYLDHPLLGKRLRKCVETLDGLATRDAGQVFGSVDAMKLQSSLTLFALASHENEHLFQHALDTWFDGAMDEKTVALIL